jgi:hypothetical protein
MPEECPKCGYVKPAPRQCKAKSKQSGVQCQRYAHPGKEVCIMHGGRAGRKPSTYRYARVMDKCPELRDNYEDLQEEVEVTGSVDLSAKEELTLLRARLMTALERGGADGSEPVDLKIVQDMWRDLTRSLQKERELDTARENLVPMAKVRELFKVAADVFSRHIPASGQEECWGELRLRMEPFRSILDKESAEVMLALPESFDE